jgi:outer membrane protein
MSLFSFFSGLTFPICLLLFGSYKAESKPVGETQKISFEDLKRLVRDKNENVQAAKLHSDAQKERTGRLARSFFPQLSAQLGSEQFKTSVEPTQQGSYWLVEASINLYRGGRDQLENQVRESYLDLSKIAYTLEYQKELAHAEQIYWTVVSLSKLISDKKEALEKNDIHLRSAKKRSGVGIATAADTVQFELHQITLEREIKKLDLEYHAYLNRLGNVLALANHESIEVMEDFPKISGTQSLPSTTNLDRQIEITAQRQLQKIDELKSKQSANWWHPKLDVYSSYGLPALSDEYSRALQKETEWVAGLRVTLDLGQGFEDRREATSKSLEAASAAQRASYKVREVNANYHDFLHDLSVLTELIRDSDSDVEKAARFLKLTENEYNRGVKNGPDLLEAFQKYFEFRERRIEYYKDYFETRSKLETLTSSAEN